MDTLWQCFGRLPSCRAARKPQIPDAVTLTAPPVTPPVRAVPTGPPLATPRGMFGAKAAASLFTIQHSGDAGQVSEGICRLSVGLIFQQRCDLIAAWDTIGTLAQRGARNALIALRLPFEVRGYSLPRWSAGRRASLVDIDADVCGARDAPRFVLGGPSMSPRYEADVSLDFAIICVLTPRRQNSRWRD